MMGFALEPRRQESRIANIAAPVIAVAATLIPIALRALKVDPALASAVFITTLTDVFGFFAFLGLATIFLRYLDQLA